MLCAFDGRVAPRPRPGRFDTPPARALPAPSGAALSAVALTIGSRRRLFEGADWNVRAGSQVAVTGPAGSGKTTLLAAIAGISAIESGSIRWGGVEFLKLPHPQREAWRRRTLGCVFHHVGLFPGFDALHNVMRPATFGDWAPGPRERSAAEALLDRAGIRARARIQDLNRVERVRVAIVRAVWAKPRAVLADEPLAHLDARAAETTRRFLQELACEAGATLIVATRNPDLARTFEYAFAVRDGKLESLAQ
ncbi:MAG: ATP-binding cassette domain-containing protein [Usitatibacter sp.]